MNLLFAERLKILRMEKALTQTELAKEINVSQRKISYWETGQLEPDLLTVCKICAYFEVSADYILGISEY